MIIVYAIVCVVILLGISMAVWVCIAEHWEKKMKERK